MGTRRTFNSRPSERSIKKADRFHRNFREAIFATCAVNTTDAQRVKRQWCSTRLQETCLRTRWRAARSVSQHGAQTDVAVRVAEKNQFRIGASRMNARSCVFGSLRASCDALRGSAYRLRVTSGVHEAVRAPAPCARFAHQRAAGARSTSSMWSALHVRAQTFIMVVGRGVAQPGSAPALGAGGRRFESGRPDHFPKSGVTPG
jgi:hypothetical protein